MTVLAHRLVTADDEVSRSGTLYVLHGFLGSGSNWSSFASRLVERRPDWRVVLVDLRLHGDSRKADPPHDITACARDLAKLHREVGDGAAVAVLGHSLGGKVALQATQMIVPNPVQTWVIDSTPSPTTGGGGIRRMLHLLEESPAIFDGRQQAVEWITAGGFDEPIARWMAMNLRREDDRWHWGLDVAGLRDLLRSFGETDLWSVVEGGSPDQDVRIVQASHGSSLTEADARRINEVESRYGTTHLVVLQGGHWLHIDNPTGLLDLVATDLPS